MVPTTLKTVIKVSYVENGIDEKMSADSMERSMGQLLNHVAVSVFQNAFSLLEFTETSYSDIVIMNNNLRHLTALECLCVLRSANVKIPVVLICEDDDQSINDEIAHSQGFQKLLRKCNFTTDVLCDIMVQFCDCKRDCELEEGKHDRELEAAHTSTIPHSSDNLNYYGESPSSMLLILAAENFSPTTSGQIQQENAKASLSNRSSPKRSSTTESRFTTTPNSPFKKLPSKSRIDYDQSNGGTIADSACGYSMNMNGVQSNAKMVHSRPGSSCGSPLSMAGHMTPLTSQLFRGVLNTGTPLFELSDDSLLQCTSPDRHTKHRYATSRPGSVTNAAHECSTPFTQSAAIVHYNHEAPRVQEVHREEGNTTAEIDLLSANKKQKKNCDPATASDEIKESTISSSVPSSTTEVGRSEEEQMVEAEADQQQQSPFQSLLTAVASKDGDWPSSH